jgi:polysaccharide export outer membrane protein
LLASRPVRAGEGRDHVLATGDLLSVTIHGYRPNGADFASDVRVDDRGYLSLPMLDPIAAAGRSLAEVRRDIVHGLRRAEILDEPSINVVLREDQGQQVIVFGAVSKPGVFALSRGQTLADVLSLAGGLSERAGNTVLLRAQPAGAAIPAAWLGPAGHPDPAAPRADGATIRLCIDGRRGDELGLDFPVRGGDVVIVPEAGRHTQAPRSTSRDSTP